MAVLPDCIGRYRVREVIGTGGFATVYRATDEHLDADVAVKVLAENHSLEPDVRQRFIEEGRRLRRVRSPHLLAVHDLGETERAQPYLVLDWANRGDLASRVALARGTGHPPSPADGRVVATAMASAMAVLHGHRLVHRDLAPKNLLLSSTSTSTSTPPEAEPTGPDVGAASLIGADERLVLADLGLSKDLAAASGLTLAAGTSGFAPPEQRRPGQTVDHRADIWAASALIVWLATNRAPDEEGQWQGSFAAAGWPVAASHVLARGLAQRPDDRYPTVELWLAALDNALAPAPASAPIPTADTIASGSSSAGLVGFIRRRFLPLLVAITLVIGGAAGVAVLRARSQSPSVSTEELGDGLERTVVEDQGITITLIGPTSAEVDQSIELTATVSGAETWQWIAPDGVVYEGEQPLELTPRSAGRATVRLLAVGDRGRLVEATRRLDVSE